MKEFSRVGARSSNLRQAQITKGNEPIPELSGTSCPNCNYGPLDGYTGIELNSVEPDENPLAPSDGMPTMCGRCGELLVYRQINEKLAIEKPTIDDLKKWENDPDLWPVLQATQKIIHEKYQFDVL